MALVYHDSADQVATALLTNIHNDTMYMYIMLVHNILLTLKSVVAVAANKTIMMFLLQAWLKG